MNRNVYVYNDHHILSIVWELDKVTMEEYSPVHYHWEYIGSAAT